MLCVPCVTVNGVTFLLGMERTTAITPCQRRLHGPSFAQLVSSFKRKLMVTAYSPELGRNHKQREAGTLFRNSINIGQFLLLIQLSIAMQPEQRGQHP